MTEVHNSESLLSYNPRSLSRKDVILLACQLQPSELSPIELETIKQKQFETALITSIAIKTIALILVFIIWLYIKIYTNDHYVDSWFIFNLCGFIYLYTAWWLNYQDNKDHRPSSNKFIYSSIPGLLVCGIGLGLLPALLNSAFETNSYIGETMLIAIISSTIVWAFPFFILSFSLLTVVCVTFCLAAYFTHPNRTFLVYGLIFLYNVLLAFILYLAFTFFVRWVLARIKYKQKSQLISLFLKDFEESSTDWLWQTNEQGYINYISSRLEEVTGINKEQLQKLRLIDLFTLKNKQTIHLQNLIYEQEQFINFEIPIVIKEQQCYWSLTGHPRYDLHGKFVGYRGVGSDVTKIHMLDLIKEEKERYESFSEISSGLSHDFNNLLASISLRLELLRTSKNINESEVNYIAEALNVCNKLARITKQMLVYSRKETLEPRHTCIDQSIELAISEVQANKNNNIEFIVDGGVHYVWCDEALFFNTIINIFNNSIRAMQHDGKIYISKNIVSFTAQQLEENEFDIVAGEYVHLCIEDTGCGFDSEALNNAFKPFFTQNRSEGGSGLGLSMAQGFARQSDGNIFISNSARGAQIDLYLPVSVTKELAEKESEAEQDEQTKYSILLVEDNEELGFLLKKYLEIHHHAIYYMRDVSQAKKEIDNNLKIDFVLSDFLLPDGKGSEVVRYARIKNKKIHALYISGYLDKPIGRNLEKAPVLKKPFTLTELSHAINSMVAKPAEQTINLGAKT